MSRLTILIAALSMALNCAGVLATSGDQPESRGARDWHGTLCTNCQPEGEVAASRVRAQLRLATKLVAANTCADPGPSAWFAEEEDHLSAYLNSTPIQYK